MPKAEVSLSDPSAEPAIIKDWLLDRKTSEIRKWLQGNFVQHDDFDFDFSDWDNEDELSDASELDGSSTRALVQYHFGMVLSTLEIEEVIGRLEKEFPDEWKPSEDRVDVDELDDDDELRFNTIADLRLELPTLMRRVGEVRESLFPHLGHNNPPDGLQFSAVELEQLQGLLSAATEISAQPDSNDYALLERLGEASLRIGGKIVSYVARKGDIFIDKAVASAGDATGKWIVRAIMLMSTGELLKSFGQAILAMISGG